MLPILPSFSVITGNSLILGSRVMTYYFSRVWFMQSLQISHHLSVRFACRQLASSGFDEDIEARLSEGVLGVEGVEFLFNNPSELSLHCK